MPKSPSVQLPTPYRGVVSWVGLLLVGAFCGSLPTRQLSAQSPNFTYCRELFLAAPTEDEGAKCFYRVARYQDRWTEAYGPIDQLLRKFPDNPHLLRLRAQVERDKDKKIELYLDALRKAAAKEDRLEQIRLHDRLWHCYYASNHLNKAKQQIELAEQLRSTDEPALQAMVDLLAAHHVRYVEEDFAASFDLLQKHEEFFSEQGLPRFRREFFWILGGTTLELGAPADALDHYREAAQIAAEEQDPVEEVRILGDSLVALRDLYEDSSEPKHTKHAEEFVRDVLARTERVRKRTGSRLAREAEANALIVLGELLRGKESIPLYQRCVELTAAFSGLEEKLKTCQFSLAAEIAKTEPDRAMQIVREALGPSASSEDLLSTTYDLHSEMRVLWETDRYEQAWEKSELVLDAIDDLRSAQPDRYGRAHSFSPWAPTYPWIAGRLLRLYQETAASRSLARAFEVIERMRARVLLEVLETREEAGDGTELRRTREDLRHVLEKKNTLQRQLRLGRGTSKSRRLASETLDDVHDQEARLRREIFRHSGRFGELESLSFATVSEIQAALKANEALLSFHLAPWESVFEPFAGGSWLILISKESARAYPLPELHEVTRRISVFTGALDQGRWLSGLAVRLYDDLLGEALTELPPHTTDLVLIPDKALHRLPFAALQASADEPPLAARYRISRVPSATLWLRRWREREAPPPAPRPALVLADPLEPRVASDAASAESLDTVARGNGELFRAASYGPLPFAREEGWSLRRYLGPGTQVLTGPQASESYLREGSLTRFGIFHFAAHAVANEKDPERAGVRLAPDPSPNGDPRILRHDGLLQFHEIVDLGQNGRTGFAGRTVVLSTCHSARGQILRGEGVFDLARAFFEGGARAVVGSLWRLEDRATARFFDDFYRHLARSISLSEALHRAQKDQIRRGAPPSAWAGIVVIGDGSLVPVPNRNGRHHPGWPIGIALLVLALAIGLAARRNPA